MIRRAGAWLGVLALLIQSAVFAAHHPNQAAAFASDPSNWCVASGHVPDESDTTGDTGRHAPFGAASLCPICQTLQHATKFLPTAGIAVAEPVSFLVFVDAPREGAPHRPPEITALNPRAPPVIA